MPLRDRPTRRHVRLPGWDYRSPGPYAVTIVTQHREWFFGDVIDDRMMFSEAGAMVERAWQEVITTTSRVSLDSYVVMPNHLHAIVTLSREGPTGNPSLSEVVHRFKAVTTTRYSNGVHLRGWQPYDGRLWQPRFYDHIIRDDADLDRSRQYIKANPANWAHDGDREPERVREPGPR